MSIRSRLLPALALVAAACSERPTAVTTPDAPVPAPQGVELSARLERQAARLAVALRDPGLRAELKRWLDGSPLPEHKLHWQRLLRQSGGRVTARAAEAWGDVEAGVRADADSSGALELYFPVDAHRAAWDGGTDLLVATAAADGDAPVAFDLTGARRVLDPATPPATPVLALVPAETDFDAPVMAANIDCIVECDPGAGSGGGSGVAGPPEAVAAYQAGVPGLYLTYAEFRDDFEGWLKGDPEFEIHVLAPRAGTNELESKQCVGAKAGGPYAWDMNTLTWSGVALVLSSTQMAALGLSQPGRGARIVAFEDDDTACAIRTDGQRFERMTSVLSAQFGGQIGGKDSLMNLNSRLVRIFTKATALTRVVQSAYSWLTTKDDLIGNAIEDDVAQQFRAPANWVVKSENTAVEGWLHLEAR